MIGLVAMSIATGTALATGLRILHDAAFSEVLQDGGGRSLRSSLAPASVGAAARAWHWVWHGARGPRPAL